MQVDWLDDEHAWHQCCAGCIRYSIEFHPFIGTPKNIAIHRCGRGEHRNSYLFEKSKHEGKYFNKDSTREGKFLLIISCHSARVSEEEEKFKSCRTKLRNSDVSAALVQLHLEYCVQLCFRLHKIGCFLNSDISKVLDNFKN